VTVTCPACAATVDDGARFCPTCGLAQVDPDDTGEVDLPVVAGRGTRTVPVEAVPVEHQLVRWSGADDVAGDDAAVCATCGAGAPAGRMLCADCGARLGDGAAAVPAPAVVHRVGREVRVVGAPSLADPPDRLRGAARLVSVLALAAVVGTGGAWLLTRGGAEPVAQPAPSPTAPTFDATAFPAEPVSLPVVAIGATGSVDEQEFPAELLVDGDPTTLWRGIEPPEPSGVAVAVGLEGRAWVRQLTFTVDAAGAEVVPVRRLRVRGESGGVVEVQLLDMTGPQVVELPSPLLGARLELVLLSGTRPGLPVALAEIEVAGHLVDPTDGDG
jgi:hypothetical protein